MLIVILICLFSDASAQGDLLVTPRRVVFEGNKRSMDLNLANTGRDTATYSISLVQIRMTEDGDFETIADPDPGQLFADKNIRFFPRTVTLGPNEAQVVKVQLIRQNQLAPGEYRSHFYFRAIPRPKPLGQAEATTEPTSISVVLTPVFGITIPAIIRIGEPMTKVTLTGLAVEIVNGVPRFSVVFNRSGNMSLFGDLSVYHISEKGVETKVGIANGIAVYTPNKTRNFQFNLANVPGIDYSKGTIRAIFSAPSDVRPERYAEAEVSLH